MRQDIIFNRKVQFMGTNAISAILMVEKKRYLLVSSVFFF